MIRLHTCDTDNSGQNDTKSRQYNFTVKEQEIIPLQYMYVYVLLV